MNEVAQWSAIVFDTALLIAIMASVVYSERQFKDRERRRGTILDDYKVDYVDRPLLYPFADDKKLNNKVKNNESRGKKTAVEESKQFNVSGNRKTAGITRKIRNLQPGEVLRSVRRKSAKTTKRERVETSKPARRPVQLSKQPTVRKTK